MKKKQSVSGNITFAVMLLLIAFFANKHVIKPLAEEAAASEEWPTTAGVISSAEMTKEWKQDEQNRNKGDYMYAANVSYNYSVGGKDYEGTRIEAAHSSTSSLESVEETLHEYAKGNSVTVYYNPESPNKAMLVPGASLILKFLFKLPLILGAVGILLILGVLKRLFFR